jgi:hypothetical protein
VRGMFDTWKDILAILPSPVILLLGITILYVTGNKYIMIPNIVAFVYFINILAILWFGLVMGAMIQKDQDEIERKKETIIVGV